MGKYKLFNDFRHREVATFATLEEAIKAHKMKGSASDAFSVYEWGNLVYPKRKKR